MRGDRFSQLSVYLARRFKLRRIPDSLGCKARCQRFQSRTRQDGVSDVFQREVARRISSRGCRLKQPFGSKAFQGRSQNGPGYSQAPAQIEFFKTLPRFKLASEDHLAQSEDGAPAQCGSPVQVTHQNKGV